MSEEYYRYAVVLTIKNLGALEELWHFIERTAGVELCDLKEREAYKEVRRKELESL